MDIQEFDFRVNALTPLLWQYNSADNIRALLQQDQDWYDENYTQFWEDWVRDVFTLDTANDFGCSVWAIILGVTFVAQQVAGDTLVGFGFEPYGNNFFNAFFGSTTTISVPLNLEQKRLVLKLRYYQLVSRGTPEEINFALVSIFGFGNAWVIDNLDMTMTTFIKTPTSDTLFILNNFDLIPRPAGVKMNIEVFSGRVGFGFAPYGKNFYDGNFAQ